MRKGFTKTALPTLWVKWFFVEARGIPFCDNQIHPGSNRAIEIRLLLVKNAWARQNEVLGRGMTQCIQKTASHWCQQQDGQYCSHTLSEDEVPTMQQAPSRCRSKKMIQGLKAEVGTALGIIWPVSDLIKNNCKSAFPWPSGPCGAWPEHFQSASALSASLAMLQSRWPAF